jgi:hypothetical protein
MKVPKRKRPKCPYPLMLYFIKEIFVDFLFGKKIQMVSYHPSHCLEKKLEWSISFSELNTTND